MAAVKMLLEKNWDLLERIFTVIDLTSEISSGDCGRVEKVLRGENSIERVLSGIRSDVSRLKAELNVYDRLFDTLITLGVFSNEDITHIVDNTRDYLHSHYRDGKPVRDWWRSDWVMTAAFERIKRDVHDREFDV